MAVVSGLNLKKSKVETSIFDSLMNSNLERKITWSFKINDFKKIWRRLDSRHFVKIYSRWSIMA